MAKYYIMLISMYIGMGLMMAICFLALFGIDLF